MNLANSAGSILPGRGLMNGCFVIKIVPATDILQQKRTSGRPNPVNDYLDDLSIGDEIQANINKEEVTGKIQRIIKNTEGDGIYAIIMDSKGKTHKIEGSQIMRPRVNKAPSDQDRLASSPALFNESKFLEYSKFTK